MIYVWKLGHYNNLIIMSISGFLKRYDTNACWLDLLWLWYKYLYDNPQLWLKSTLGTANSHHIGQCLGTSKWHDSIRYAHRRTSTQTHAYWDITYIFHEEHAVFVLPALNKCYMRSQGSLIRAWAPYIFIPGEKFTWPGITCRKTLLCLHTSSLL